MESVAPWPVALAGMVEDEVEDDADVFGLRRAATVSRSSLTAAGHETRVERHHGDGIVAPAVGEAERGQMPLVDPGGDRHQLDGIDAEAAQMGEDGGVGEGG